MMLERVESVMALSVSCLSPLSAGALRRTNLVFGLRLREERKRGERAGALFGPRE